MWMKLLQPSCKGPPPNCHTESLFQWATATFTSCLRSAVFHWPLHCHPLPDSFRFSFRLLWTIFLSPLCTYWDLLGLFLGSSFLAILHLLHGPPHPPHDWHANDSQMPVSNLVYYLSILAVPNCLRCPKRHTRFSSLAPWAPPGMSTSCPSLPSTWQTPACWLRSRLLIASSVMPFLVLLGDVPTFTHCMPKAMSMIM